MQEFSAVHWVLLGVEFICTIVVSCIAWFLKRELNKTEKFDDRLRDVEKNLAENYVTKEDWYRSNSEILAKLDKIQDLILKMYQER